MFEKFDTEQQSRLAWRDTGSFKERYQLMQRDMILTEKNDKHKEKDNQRILKEGVRKQHVWKKKDIKMIKLPID